MPPDPRIRKGTIFIRHVSHADEPVRFSLPWLWLDYIKSSPLHSTRAIITSLMPAISHTYESPFHHIPSGVLSYGLIPGINLDNNQHLAVALNLLELELLSETPFVTDRFFPTLPSSPPSRFSIFISQDKKKIWIFDAKSNETFSFITKGTTVSGVARWIGVCYTNLFGRSALNQEVVGPEVCDWLARRLNADLSLVGLPAAGPRYKSGPKNYTQRWNVITSQRDPSEHVVLDMFREGLSLDITIARVSRQEILSPDFNVVDIIYKASILRHQLEQILETFSQYPIPEWVPTASYAGLRWFITVNPPKVFYIHDKQTSVGTYIAFRDMTHPWDGIEWVKKAFLECFCHPECIQKSQARHMDAVGESTP